MFRIAILVSGRHGRGSNMAALAGACASGVIPRAQIACVVGTHAGSPALRRAQELGLDTRVAERDVEAVLADSSPDLVCLAGYLRLLPREVLRRYPDRVLNMHPALLPAFGGQGMYGMRVHEAVLARGCKVTGVTVHFVDEQFDSGPILLQQCVPVREGDTAQTLAERVLAAEHACYPRAVSLVAEGRVRIDGRRVVVTAPPGDRDAQERR